MTVRAQLLITAPGQPDRIVALHDSMTIGRDGDTDIVLESITVSRCHAILLHTPSALLLIDLQSTNGTLVNGAPVPPDQPVRLADGDSIQFGQVLARYVAGASGERSPVQADDRAPAPRKVHSGCRSAFCLD